jgi:hypothetical protein
MPERLFPARPTYDEWLAVLNRRPVDEETLRWLLKWINGWPELADEPHRSLLWANLAATADLPWTEELLASLAAGFTDGPPSAVHAVPFLNHPASGLGLRRNLGFWASSAGTRDNRRGRVAAEALTLAGDPASQVARWLGYRHHFDPNGLLADSWRLYASRFDQVCDRGQGGGTARMEIFLGLVDDGWTGPVDDLISAMLRLTERS